MAGQPLFENMFSGIEAVKASRESNYVRAGIYLVQLDRIKADKTRKMVPFLAVEMDVLAVLGFEVKTSTEPPAWALTEVDLDDGPVDIAKLPPTASPTHGPGDRMSHLLMSGNDAFLPNVKGMIMGLTGCKENEVTMDDCRDIAGDDQVLSGQLTIIRARTIVTKAGKLFTKVTYKSCLKRSQFDAIAAKLGIAAPTDAKWVDEHLAMQDHGND